MQNKEPRCNLIAMYLLSVAHTGELSFRHNFAVFPEIKEEEKKMEMVRIKIMGENS